MHGLLRDVSVAGEGRVRDEQSERRRGSRRGQKMQGPRSPGLPRKTRLSETTERLDVCACGARGRAGQWAGAEPQQHNQTRAMRLDTKKEHSIANFFPDSSGRRHYLHRARAACFNYLEVMPSPMNTEVRAKLLYSYIVPPFPSRESERIQKETHNL